MICSVDDILRMLDSFFRDEGQWWDEFYKDRHKNIPFFVNAPDENLVSYFEDGRMQCGRALELGCGPGRNALYMVRQGCTVDAVDISKEAIRWAKERAKDGGLETNLSKWQRHISWTKIENGFMRFPDAEDICFTKIFILLASHSVGMDIGMCTLLL